MYWLKPPSLVRRIAAVSLVLGAVAWDVQSAAGTDYPVAAEPIRAGAEITPDVVRYVRVPTNALPATDPIGSRAAIDIEPGDPLGAAVLAGPVVVPDGWWTVPIAVGTTASPGDQALLVVADPPLSVIGIVVSAQVGDPYELGHRPAEVAVPADAAPIVAAAEHEGLLVAALRSTTGDR